MKKLMMMAAVFVTGAAMLAPCDAWAAETYADGSGNVWTYTLTNESAMVSSFSSESTDVTVPVSLGEKPVALFGAGAFADCVALTNVVFPNQDGMITFWQGAFRSGISVTMEAEEGYAFSRWIDADGNGVNLVSFTNDFVSVRAEFAPVVIVTNVSFRQRYPWNGLVDIDCTVECVDPTTNITLSVSARDEAAGKSLAVRSIWLQSDETHTNVLSVTAGTYRLVWDAGRDNPGFVGESVVVAVQGGLVGTSGLYMVIDLSGGSDAAFYPVSYLNDVPQGGWTDEYKTTKLVMRRIPAGTFIMGCETTEVGFTGDEAMPHEVTISKPFYIGSFEVTQKQYELVTGNNPSLYKGDARPVECVSWNVIRGNSTTYNWPATSEVDTASFMGILRMKTGISSFDLPTEAQWEYACRAGTTTALNSGRNLVSSYNDSAMDEVGRYGYNSGCHGSSDGKGDCVNHTVVGLYLPNAWGLYDMHGNVSEWCLDYWQSRTSFPVDAVTDPEGTLSGYYRANRGGCFWNEAYCCRSASRWSSGDTAGDPTFASYGITGFRLNCLVGLGNDGGNVVGSLAFGRGVSEANNLDLNTGVRIVTEGEPEHIAYSPRWGGTETCVITVDGISAITNSEEGVAEWIPEGAGWHTLTHTAGDTIYTAQFTVLGEDVETHAGTLTTNEVWSADKVHLITATVTVPSGVSLIIESGAVVKFMPGTSLVVEGDASCTAQGVTFTHVNDDTAGGDTLMDGEETSAIMSEYTITGFIVDDDNTEYRYLPPQELTSYIGSDTRLRGYRTYIVSNSVTVASGATLTLMPGTILKFVSGRQFTVNGVLDARGTRAAPVVFTSLRDDERGGDTNGDGARTAPAGGDWNGLWVYGRADLAHTELLYSGNGNERGIVQTSGGALTMTGCLVAHARNDGIWNWGGTIAVTNTVFTDTGWATAPYNGSRNEFVNCVFWGNDVGLCYWSHWSGRPSYVNCVFSECGNGWCELGSGYYGAPPAAVAVRNCLFWNPTGRGAQSCDRVGADGNVWGDPVFVNAAGGDYRTLAGSACVDAGDTSSAPENDAYGRPRDHEADIGIYEAVSPYVDGLDLVPVEVAADMAEVMPGDTLTVRWTVANRGLETISGTWRDVVSLVSESGVEIELGEKTVTGPLASGATLANSATFVLPPVDEGEWKVKVNVNAYQDVFEGVSRLNNAIIAAGVVAVTVQTVDAASGFSGTLSAGTRTVVKIPFAEGDAARMVRILLPPGAVATWGFGFVPSSSVSGSVTAGDAGVAFLAPDGKTDVYVVLESSVEADWSLRTEVARVAVTSVEPAELPSSGMATVTIDGAGFTAVTAVSFSSEANVPASAMTFVSSERILATVDCAKLKAGAHCGVTVSEGAFSASLPSAIAVQDAPPSPNLVFSIETPSLVRPGRIATGFFEWRNTGNVEALAPVVTLKASKDVRLSLTPDGEFKKSVIFVGIGQSAPVGRIRPGECCRQYFYFIPGRGSYRISYSVLGYDWNVDRGNSVFATWKDFAEGLSLAATRLGLAGYATSDFKRIRDLANKTALGFPNAIVTGTLVSEIASRPMAGRKVSLKNASGDEVDSALTGADGSFAFFGLPSIAGMALETEDVDGAKLTPIDLSSGDCLGIKLRSSLRPILGSVVSAGYDRLAGVPVDLLADGVKLDSAVADAMGEFAFWGVTNTNCVVRVPAVGVCAGTEVEIGDGPFTGQIVLPFAGRIEGSVAFATGDKTPADLPLMLVQAGGATNAVKYSTVTDEEGRFTFSGLAPGEYKLSSIFRYAETFKGVTVVVAAGKVEPLEVVIPSLIPFQPSMPVGFAPCEISFEIDDEAVLEAKAFQWDFDGDGTVDSTEAAPTATYAESGIYDVVLRAQGEDGTWTIYRYPSCVEVRESVTPVLKEGVKALSVKSIISMPSADEIVVDEETGKDCKKGDVLVVPFKDGLTALEVCSADNYTEGSTSLKVKAAPVTKVFSKVSGTVAKGGVDSFFADMLSNLLPQLANSCSYSPFSMPLPDLNLLWVTVSSGFNGYLSFEVADSKIVMMHGRVTFDTQISTGFDFSLTVPVTVSASVDESFELPPLGPIPMAGTVYSEINGTLFAGYDGRFEWESDKYSFGFEFHYDDYGLNGGFIKTRQKSELPDSGAFCSGFSISGTLLGGDIGAGFGLGKAKAKAIALGPSLGFDITGKWSYNDEFTPDEFQMNMSIGGYLNFTPFEVGLWHFKAALFPQSWPIATLSAQTEPSKSAIPKIISASADSSGTATVTTTVDWNKSKECDWAEDINWGDGCTGVGHSTHTHTYDMKNCSDRTEMIVVVSQDYDDFLTKQKKAKTTIVLNKKKCQCGPECEYCDGNCEDCQCGDGGGGGDNGGSGGSTVNSEDPNEMVGPLGEGDTNTQRFLRPGQWATYTVFFENKSDATAAAQEVRVTNPLSKWLDWSTVEMGEIAFNNQIDMGLSGLANGVCETQMTGTNFIVRTSVETDTAVGEVNWYLRIVDPCSATGWPTDPRAGILPPNDDMHRGEGHLTYRVRVREDAPRNVVITNSATIIFDYNDPIETDPAWWNTVAGLANVKISGEVEGDVTNLNLIVGMPYGELPTPKAREGYAFGGWYTGPNGTGRRVTAQSLVEAGDSGLYAHWLTNAYTVRFNANGGEGMMPDQAFEFDESGELDANAFTKRYFAFTGWATNGMDEAVYADCAVVTNLTAVDGVVVNLYATWQRMSVDVSFVDGEDAVAATLLAGLPYGELPEPAARAGYTFDGWFTALEGGDKVSAETVVTANATLYAHWAEVPPPIPDMWTVTFDAQGGVVSEATRAVTNGCAVGALPETARDGYNFDGWFAAASGGEAVSSATVITTNMTFYAHWTEIVELHGGKVENVEFTKAQVVLGALYDAKGNLAGTVELKFGKINAKKQVVKVSGSATIIVGGKAKKITAKAVNVTVDATKRVPPTTLAFKAPIGNMTFAMDADGVFTLKNDKYEMVGMRTRQSASLPVSVGGAMANGTMYFNVAMDKVPDFGKDGRLLEESLPVDEQIKVSGGRWSFGKAATLKYAKSKATGSYELIGLNDSAKPNVSGLKLTYTAKTGLFKGSFKLYVTNEATTPTGKAPKLKKFTVNVIGFVVDGKGYGEATLKKPAGTWAVTVDSVPPAA